MKVEIGDRYHCWTVLSNSQFMADKGSNSYYYCECVCGYRAHVRSDGLKKGKSKSCGCQRYKGANEMIGQKFNRWNVISISEIRNGHRYVSCICDCGFTSDLRVTSLKTGQTRSCGCLRNEEESSKRKGGRFVVDDNGSKKFIYLT